MKRTEFYGEYKFTGTNLSISAGTDGPDQLEQNDNPKSLFKFLNMLLDDETNIGHVIAVGNPIVYQLRNDDGTFVFRTKENEYVYKDEEGKFYDEQGNELEQSSEITNKKICPHDFFPYMKPQASGFVKLPDYPELKDYRIQSKITQKVGRIISYELTISSKKKSKTLSAHNLLMDDRQPLNLTDAELKRLYEIQNQANDSESNIHIHCRGGHGRSASLLAVLASRIEGLKEKYQNSEDLIKALRVEIWNTKNPYFKLQSYDDIKSKGRKVKEMFNSDFIETERQLANTKEMIDSYLKIQNFEIDESENENPEFTKIYSEIDLFLREKIDLLEECDGLIFEPELKSQSRYTADLNETQKQLYADYELYKLFLNSNTANDINDINEKLSFSSNHRLISMLNWSAGQFSWGDIFSVDKDGAKLKNGSDIAIQTKHTTDNFYSKKTDLQWDIDMKILQNYLSKEFKIKVPEKPNPDKAFFGVLDHQMHIISKAIKVMPLCGQALTHFVEAGIKEYEKLFKNGMLNSFHSLGVSAKEKKYFQNFKNADTINNFLETLGLSHQYVNDLNDAAPEANNNSLIQLAKN